MGELVGDAMEMTFTCTLTFTFVLIFRKKVIL